VVVPAWRSDVIHECDILEDVAICYGFQNIIPVLPPSKTIAQQQRANNFSDQLRLEMANVQFNEALNFALCSKAEMTTEVRSTDTSKLITITSAKTKEFQTGRTTLVPGLLRTAVENKNSPLPYRLFEVGDCIVKDPSNEVGARNERKLAGLITDEVTSKKGKGLYSQVHGTVDLLLLKLRIPEYKLRPVQVNMFFDSQQAAVFVEEEQVGVIGILHP
jgi:phenylalanyl-tRNA synthetase beta chain